MNNSDDRWHTSPSFWEKLKPKAREMRVKPTEAEKRLWCYLRDKKLKKYKFRRQHSLGQFIVDFYCEKARLVVEVDGPIHDYQIEKDATRQQYLEQHEYKVLRFSNESITKNLGSVIDQILLYLNNT